MTPTVCSSLRASSWLKTSEGKRQGDTIHKSIGDTIHKSIAHDLKKKRPNSEHSILDFEELVTHFLQSPLLPEEIVVGMEEEGLETDQMPIKEEKRELVKESASEVSDLKGQEELDSICVELDSILKKGSQYVQETFNHRIQMITILASLEYCHLGASLEKAAQQVSNLRDQVDLLRSRHAKLGRCLKNYNQQVSDTQRNIVVLNSLRARLETFDLKESPQEICRLEGVVKLKEYN